MTPVALTVNVSHLGDWARPYQDQLLAIARCSDELGFEQIMLTDHVVLGTNLDSHGALGGPFPWPPEHPYPDPIVMLSAIAAVTTNIRLSTGVLLAPMRAAVLLAKMIATLDQLSHGRVDLGVGTGWQQEEFDALGVPMEGKAARMDDTIRACKVLWRGGPSTFSSPTVSYTDVFCVPLPAQGADVPIWFAGAPIRRVAQRVAELGAGWLPLNARDFDGLSKGLTMVREEFERAGRDPATAGMRIALPTVREAGAASLERTFAQVDRYVEAGATGLSFTIGDFVETVEAAKEALRWVREAFPRPVLAPEG
jgi:probable F420-dependent oxidoreductase